MDPIPISNLRNIRRQTEDCAALTHELAANSQQGMRLIVAASNSPAREIPTRLVAIADWLRDQSVIELNAYRLARQAAGGINVVLEQIERSAA